MNPILRTQPEPSPGSGLHRTVIVLEILSDRYIGTMDIKDVVDEMQEGDFSGRFEIIDSREVGKLDMARLLQAQGSDPGFLLDGIDDNEIGWKYGLHSGDQITWHDPDGGKCTRTFFIGSIQYLSDDAVRITDRDGSVIEALLSEIS